MTNDFKPNKEKREEMMSHIKDFFRKERDEEIGDLAAQFLLDFIIEKISPEFYNQGVEDCYSYLNNQITDMLELKK